jgi:hypothetical protein
MCARAAPWFKVRFHRVLAPNAKLRKQVVASALPYVPLQEITAPNPLQLPLFDELFKEPDVRRTRPKPWAWRLRHVFAMDVNVCPQCAGPMKWREVALTPALVRVCEETSRVRTRPHLS